MAVYSFFRNLFSPSPPPSPPPNSGSHRSPPPPPPPPPPPTLSIEEAIYDVSERMPITLKCNCTSFSGTVKWSCGEKIYSQNNTGANYKVELTDKSIYLKINCVTESDEGEYICEVHSGAETVKSQPIILNVSNILRYPKINYKARVCRSTKLVCEIKHPDPKFAADIKWMHNSEDVDVRSGRHKMISKPFPSLIIDKVCMEDTGTYECRFSHPDMKYPSRPLPQKSIILELSPEVHVAKRKYVAQIHSKVTFDCKVYGADDCTWHHNGEPISPLDNRFTTNEDMSLTISPVQPSDAGKYVCEITNHRMDEKVTSEEVELCTISSDFSKGYAKYFQPSENREKEVEMINSLSAKIPDNKACFWFVGQYGAGKSSAISSIQSWKDGRISTLALPGKSQGSFTSKISGSMILDDKVMLYDIPGLEGSMADDPKQFSYKPFDEIIKSTPEGDSLKSCVVYVLDSSDMITDCDIARMTHFQNYTKERDNFQMVVLLTKIDKASPNATTVQEMLESEQVCNVTQQVHDKVGLPVNCIFAIYNYCKQMERDGNMDLLILQTFRSLLERLLDIYARLDRKKVT